MMRRGKFVIFYGNTKGIRLSASTLAANAAQGTAIGTLSVVGGAGGTYTFTLTNSAGNRVQVAAPNGSNLQAGITPSPAGSYTIGVHADNGAGSVFDANFVITAITGTDTLLVQPGDDLLVDVGNPLLVQ